MILREMQPEDKEYVFSNLCNLWLGVEKDFAVSVPEIITMEHTTHPFVIQWPDGSPAALLGVDQIPDSPPEKGLIWMVAAREIDRHPLKFVRHTRGLIPEVFSKAPHDILGTIVSIPFTTNLNFACRWHGLEIVGTLPAPQEAPWARFDLEVKRESPGPRPMINLRVDLDGPLQERFPGHKHGSLVIVLRKPATVQDALRALSLEPDELGEPLLNNAKAGLDTALFPNGIINFKKRAIGNTFGPWRENMALD